MASAMNSSGTQMPSLRPLSTLSPWRIRDGRRGSVTTAWPSAASVGRAPPRGPAPPGPQLAEERRGERRPRARSSAAGRCRAGARARRTRAAASAGRCATRRRTTPAQRRLGQHLHRLARCRRVDDIESLPPNHQPDPDEDDRGRDRGAVDTARHDAEADQRQRDNRETPLHPPTLSLWRDADRVTPLARSRLEEMRRSGAVGETQWARVSAPTAAAASYPRAKGAKHPSEFGRNW